VEVDSTPKCIRPESQVDGGRPALVCMEELFLRTLSEITDGFLGNAIMEVGVDPTEGELLPFGTATVLEGVVCKSSVVTVVVEYLYAVLLGKVFKSLFGFHGLLGGKLGHEVNVLEP
jgi:hypothetical protein